mgnify:CR=1 FL=1
MIERLKEKDDSLDGSWTKWNSCLFKQMERKSTIIFFIKRRITIFRCLCRLSCVRPLNRIWRKSCGEMNENGITRVGNIPLTASYMLFGAVPVLENDGLSTAEKALGIRMIMKCILEA